MTVLSAIEMMQAAITGALRHHDCAVKGRHDYATEGDSFEATSLARHVNGAGGEIAVAKERDVYWGGHINRFNGQGGDVGKQVQVRTRLKAQWPMIINERDPDDVPFVKVSGLAPHYEVHGWVWGRDGKREEWRDPSAHWRFLVPAEALHSMDELP
jgi:hypothetical protein